ncbi:MAG: hypothetical protein Q8M11_13115 [Sulfuritalea sp.]|nr:hypothetical protein [Sulfuritalea sp.]MDP1982747.1 hypothetical protein [Sulfuritalea sp.]
MPKSLATRFVPCLAHSGRICVAFSALALLPTAIAAVPEPTLRRSEQLDVRRIGKVSEDERSVLRIEWRVGLAGVDEAQSVQQMLDNLRRIEQSMVAISVLVRNMPVAKPVAAPVVAEPAALDDDGTRLMIANLAAISLVALWWFRRRKPAEPGEETADRPDSRPLRKAAPAARPAARSQPGSFAQDMQALDTTQRIEPGVPAEDVMGDSVPIPDAPLAKGEPDAAPLSDTGARSLPQPETQPLVIDFSLEEADPETMAREAAKQPAPFPKAPVPVAVSEPETNVEPTLQLAEIMLSMGLEQGAAQALLEYTEANPRHALYHWLKLLGIYRNKGLNKEFAETAEKLRQNFNIQAEFSETAGTRDAPTLEKFSRVAQHVQEIWQRPRECIDYLQRLLEDNRDGARAGFPQSVAEEIILLTEILKINSGDNQPTGS